MKHPNQTYRFLGVLLAAFSLLPVCAQEVKTDAPVPHAQARREGLIRATVADSLAIDTILVQVDSLSAMADSIRTTEDYLDVTTNRTDTASASLTLSADSLQGGTLPNLQERFIPDPKKAMWLAIVIPGGGQIYNRKYWKLPLVYGGFLGCLYAMTWNNTMYRDYSQAYIDIMDSDENTKSYENFLPVNYDVQSNQTRLQEMFQRKKDYYRRYRDLSIFVMIGVYALSVLDAYIDAELSSFDISRDLSMKVQPTVIHDRYSAMRGRGMSTTSYGLQCSLSF